jgi:hypothetical protein
MEKFGSSYSSLSFVIVVASLPSSLKDLILQQTFTKNTSPSVYCSVSLHALIFLWVIPPCFKCLDCMMSNSRMIDELEEFGRRELWPN